MKRKAVSPVIATVILIAIAITVAVGICYWMGNVPTVPKTTASDNVTIIGEFDNKWAFVEDGNTRWYLLVWQPLGDDMARLVVTARAEDLTPRQKVDLFLLETGKPVKLVCRDEGKGKLILIEIVADSSQTTKPS